MTALGKGEPDDEEMLPADDSPPIDNDEKMPPIDKDEDDAATNWEKSHRRKNAITAMFAAMVACLMRVGPMSEDRLWNNILGSCLDAEGIRESRGVFEETLENAIKEATLSRHQGIWSLPANPLPNATDEEMLSQQMSHPNGSDDEMASSKHLPIVS